MTVEFTLIIKPRFGIIAFKLVERKRGNGSREAQVIQGVSANGFIGLKYFDEVIDT